MATTIAVRVLIHRLERDKPSSTGNLVARALPAARIHTYSRVSRHLPPTTLPADSIPTGHDLLVLHPSGTPLSPGWSDRPPPCLLLLDGTWRQAGEMLRSVEGGGRCVRLPGGLTAESRFWLRHQHAPGWLSTAETLVAALDLLGDAAAAGGLRLHFELHVLVSLLARGRRDLAERFLGESALRGALGEILGTFDPPPFDRSPAAGSG